MNRKMAWEWEIKPASGWFNGQLSGLGRYRELFWRFVRRDLMASYQQTMLGPVWVFLQPLLTTLVYFIIFSRIAKLPTEGIPGLLFYLPGCIIWSYFSDCFQSSMNSFVHNAALFSKVYFPRIIAPLSLIIFHTVRLGIQLLLFLFVYIFFLTRPHAFSPSAAIVLVPLLIAITAVFALGAGLMVSVLTVKYRDLENIVQFLLRLFMLATPVIYPLSLVPEKYRLLFRLNPLTGIVESFRTIFFNHQPMDYSLLLESGLLSLVFLLAGIALFHRHEIKAMDII